MPTTRRSFIAGASLAGSLSALPFSSLSAAAHSAQTEPVFGPKIGQALLSRNENPYGTWSGYSRVSTGRIEDVACYAAALPEMAGRLWG